MKPIYLRKDPCPLCEGRQAKLCYQSQMDGMTIVACTDCGFTSQDPRHPEINLGDPYLVLQEYVEADQSRSAKVDLFRARIKSIRSERSLPPQGRFLDFGTGSGAMLSAVKHELPDWECWAIEPSASCRDSLAAEGWNVVSSLDGLPDGSTFDWINLDNVLEHLADPIGTLRALAARLTGQGFLYVEVPDERHLVFKSRINDWVRGFRKPPTFPGHINLFTPRTLRKVLETAGLKVEVLRSESISAPGRFPAATGAFPSRRASLVLKLLALTKLDLMLGLSYFLRSESVPAKRTP